MHNSTILLLITVLTFASYYLFRNPAIKRNGHPLRRAPNTLPLVGNGILFLRARHKLFTWFVKCEQQFGFETFQISVPSLPPGVVINDPKNLEYVFKNEGIFAKGTFFKQRSWDLFGNGIINADGELWRVQRKAGLNFLNNSNLKILTHLTLPQYLSRTIQHLTEAAAEEVIDLEDILHELTTQLMGRMAYDMEIHNSDPFSQSFDYASGKIGERFQNPLWQFTEIFTGGKFRSSLKRVKTFGSILVANAVQGRGKPRSPSKEGSSFDEVSGSLINSLLDSIDDHQMVADAALNYLSAGRDTTAQALTWTFYLLMRNSSAAERIRVEVQQVIDSQTQDLDTRSFLPSVLPYTTAVFYETLRLYPPVPFELKQCEEATTLPDGTYLPKSAILLWCTWAMNRSRLIWGHDSHEFRPERWLEYGKLISKTAFEYPVFNGGPRTCLGRKMAELMAVQVIGTLVMKFDFEQIDKKERISKNSLTLPMEGGLPCRVKRRSQNMTL